MDWTCCHHPPRKYFCFVEIFTFIEMKTGVNFLIDHQFFRRSRCLWWQRFKKVWMKKKWNKNIHDEYPTIQSIRLLFRYLFPRPRLHFRVLDIISRRRGYIFEKKKSQPKIIFSPNLFSSFSFYFANLVYIMPKSVLIWIRWVKIWLDAKLFIVPYRNNLQTWKIYHFQIKVWNIHFKLRLTELLLWIHFVYEMQRNLFIIIGSMINASASEYSKASLSLRHEADVIGSTTSGSNRHARGRTRTCGQIDDRGCQTQCSFQ